MLSEENKQKLVLTGLYSHKPDINMRSTLYVNDLFWCFNWTFKIYRRNDIYYFVDTYFNDKYYEITNENIDEFKLIFDFNDVERISESEATKYDDEDVFHVAVDSGGMYCGGKWFIKKGAKKSKKKVIALLEEEIRSAKLQLMKYNTELLNTMADNENYK